MILFDYLIFQSLIKLNEKQKCERKHEIGLSMQNVNLFLMNNDASLWNSNLMIINLKILVTLNSYIHKKRILFTTKYLKLQLDFLINFLYTHVIKVNWRVNYDERLKYLRLLKTKLRRKRRRTDLLLLYEDRILKRKWLKSKRKNKNQSPSLIWNQKL